MHKTASGKHSGISLLLGWQTEADVYLPECCAGNGASVEGCIVSPGDIEILEQVRRHLVDEVAVLRVKIKYHDAHDHGKLSAYAHTCQVKNGLASNIERIIANENHKRR
jgi:hypothetical protein